MRLENSPADPAYRNPRLNWQFTGNSESTTSFFDLMREMGGGARKMLISAASDRMGSPEASFRTDGSKVIHVASGRSIAFAELAPAAAKKSPPRNPRLKSPSEWKLIGKSLKRTDTVAKISGTAVFRIDVKVPNMAYAAVRTCPVFDGKVASVDRSSIAGMPGVIAVVDIPNGVAIAAETWWQAKQAIDRLNVTWNYGNKLAAGSPSIQE